MHTYTLMHSCTNGHVHTFIQISYVYLFYSYIYTTPQVTIEINNNNKNNKITNIKFHPHVKDLLCVSVGSILKLIDLTKASTATTATATATIKDDECTIREIDMQSEGVKTIHSICWNGSGSLLASISDDCKLRVHDFKSNSKTVQIGKAHDNKTMSSVAWHPFTDVILTSGTYSFINTFNSFVYIYIYIYILMHSWYIFIHSSIYS